MDFVDNALTIAEIGRRHGISGGAVSSRAARAGLPKRRRGRRPDPEPSERDRTILAALRTRGFAELGRQHRLSRQRIHGIAKRWHGWNSESVTAAPPNRQTP